VARRLQAMLEPGCRVAGGIGRDGQPSARTEVSDFKHHAQTGDAQNVRAGFSERASCPATEARIRRLFCVRILAVIAVTGDQPRPSASVSQNATSCAAASIEELANRVVWCYEADRSLGCRAVAHDPAPGGLSSLQSAAFPAGQDPRRNLVKRQPPGRWYPPASAFPLASSD
jgi:hypothetical protein